MHETEGTMETFICDDGRILQVVAGYRERVLGQRASYSPRAEWTDQLYATAARKKLKRTRQILAEFAQWGGHIEDAHVLDMGCGDSINSLLVALWPVESVVGIDMELSLLEAVERRDRVRVLASHVCRQAKLSGDIDEILDRLPIRLLKMDATSMAFGDASHDLLISRSAIEHIASVEKAFDEIARVVRPGGLIYLSTDPYFSPRGCHKSGIVDIPWAHTRLSLDEFRRFVTESEGPEQALRRCRRLETLNPYTIREWREKIEACPFDILEWREERSDFAETLLDEYSEVTETTRAGVERRDLIHDRLKMWLRRR